MFGASKGGLEDSPTSSSKLDLLLEKLDSVDGRIVNLEKAVHESRSGQKDASDARKTVPDLGSKPDESSGGFAAGLKAIGLNAESLLKSGEAGSMDELVQHLQASQARFDLKRSKPKHFRLGRFEKFDMKSSKLATSLVSCGRMLPSIHPDGKLRLRWNLLHLVMLIACVFLVPLRLCFAPFVAERFWLSLELALDFFFLADTASGFFVGYYRDGQSVVERDRRKVAKNYLTQWFCLDIASSLPLAPILLLSTGNFDDPASHLTTTVLGVRLLKLFRCARLAHLVSSLRNSRRMQKLLQSINPSTILITDLVVAVFILWHWLCGVFWFLQLTAESGISPYADISIRHPYVISLHWTVSVTTGLNSPVPAITDAQALYESLVVCLGLAMQSFFFGTVASAVGELDLGAKERSRKLQAVRDYVRHKRVPQFVRERIVDFYEYTYGPSGGARMHEELTLLSTLPARLRIELAVVNNRPVVEHFELFQKAEAGAIALLALLITQQTRAPGENIVFQGEPSDALYFVRSGELRVFVRSGDDGKPLGRRTNRLTRPLRNTGDAGEGDLGDAGDSFKPQRAPEHSPLFEKAAHASEWDRFNFVRLAREAKQAKDVEERESAGGVAGAAGGAAGAAAAKEPHRPHDGSHGGSRGEGHHGLIRARRDSRISGATRSVTSMFEKIGHTIGSLGGHHGHGHEHNHVHSHGHGHGHSHADEHEEEEDLGEKSAPARSKRSSFTGAPLVLRRQGTATIAFKTIVRQALEMSRELEKKAEAEAEALREIKERSISDIAALGTPVGRLTDGDAFGEQSFITKTPAMATVRTVEYCELVSLTRADLECVSEAYPRLRSEVDAFVEGRKARYSEHNRKIVKNLDNTGTTGAQKRRRDSLLLRAIRPGSLHNSRSSQIAADMRAQDELRELRAQSFGGSLSTKKKSDAAPQTPTSAPNVATGHLAGVHTQASPAQPAPRTPLPKSPPSTKRPSSRSKSGFRKSRDRDREVGPKPSAGGSSSSVSGSDSGSASTVLQRKTIDELLSASQNPRLSSAELQITC
jgi:CRP-like cAMP-binding protein